MVFTYSQAQGANTHKLHAVERSTRRRGYKLPKRGIHTLGTSSPNMGLVTIMLRINHTSRGGGRRSPYPPLFDHTIFAYRIPHQCFTYLRFAPASDRGDMPNTRERLPRLTWWRRSPTSTRYVCSKPTWKWYRLSYDGQLCIRTSCSFERKLSNLTPYLLKRLAFDAFSRQRRRGFVEIFPKAARLYLSK